MAALVAGLVLSFLLFGYCVIYWRNADMDFMVIYNAFLLNDGKPQHYFDHPAYITILSLSSGFGCCMPRPARRVVTVVDSAGRRCRGLRSRPDPCRARRTGAQPADRDRLRADLRGPHAPDRARLADRAAGDQAFAFSGGIAVHSRILRSELVAACPVIFALLILIVAGRRAHVARPLALALAAALCVLGLQNKVQAVLLIGALPLLILPFGNAAERKRAFLAPCTYRLACGGGLRPS